MADADDSVSSEGWGYYWWSFLFVTILFMLILWLLRSWWRMFFKFSIAALESKSNQYRQLEHFHRGYREVNTRFWMMHKLAFLLQPLT